jgi:hypothetical protein
MMTTMAIVRTVRSIRLSMIDVDYACAKIDNFFETTSFFDENLRF